MGPPLLHSTLGPTTLQYALPLHSLGKLVSLEEEINHGEAVLVTRAQAHAANGDKVIRHVVTYHLLQAEPWASLWAKQTPLVPSSDILEGRPASEKQTEKQSHFIQWSAQEDHAATFCWGGGLYMQVMGWPPVPPRDDACYSLPRLWFRPLGAPLQKLRPLHVGGSPPAPPGPSYVLLGPPGIVRLLFCWPGKAGPSCPPLSLPLTVPRPCTSTRACSFRGCHSLVSYGQVRAQAAGHVQTGS